MADKKTHHRRAEVLREVVAAIDLRRDGRLPTDVPGVRETFTDDLDLIGALHLRWHQRLVVRIEQQLDRHPMQLERGVREGWADAARSMPGVRLVVDHALDQPVDEAMARALGRATVKERTQLALLAGLASAADARAEAVGRRIEHDARELWRPGTPMPSAPAVDLARHPVTEVPVAQAPRPRPAASEPHPTPVRTGSATFARRLRAALSS